ncbi:MAG TPA: ferritin-like protein [Chloroflexia bacterium]|nr:ferritin-like protein [Chloroflexia bacterium]
MADPTTNWTLDALHTHLQDAIDLELWTLPLYICAWTSLKNPTGDPQSNVGNISRSVIIQEMLHLELASNLALAFGLTPQFSQPIYTPQDGIPFHTPEEPLNGPYEVRLGPLDENAINLFLEIELPKDLSADKGHGTLDPAATYDSIGEFYQALRAGVTQLWDTCYQPDSVNLQKTDFSDYPGVPASINSLQAAMQAIDTIVDQGEGADSKGGDVPTEYRPNDDPVGDLDDDYSHYERFLMVKSFLPQIETYTDNGSPATEQQAALNQAFTKLLQDLATSFTTTNPPNAPEPGIVGDSYTQMFAIPNLAIAVWQAGACPEFRVLSS